ncbi:hypothetical protein J6590_001272 [Homalodisca vitripennis]|nr:hypothetical protein J6590_001272 [Homalodisca vitripennis]
MNISQAHITVGPTSRSAAPPLSGAIPHTFCPRPGFTVSDLSPSGISLPGVSYLSMFVSIQIVSDTETDVSASLLPEQFVSIQIVRDTETDVSACSLKYTLSYLYYLLHSFQFHVLKTGTSLPSSFTVSDLSPSVISLPGVSYLSMFVSIQIVRDTETDVSACSLKYTLSYLYYLLHSFQFHVLKTGTSLPSSFTVSDLSPSVISLPGVSYLSMFVSIQIVRDTETDVSACSLKYTLSYLYYLLHSFQFHVLKTGTSLPSSFTVSDLSPSVISLPGVSYLSMFVSIQIVRDTETDVSARDYSLNKSVYHNEKEINKSPSCDLDHKSSKTLAVSRDRPMRERERVEQLPEPAVGDKSSDGGLTATSGQSLSEGNTTPQSAPFVCGRIRIIRTALITSTLGWLATCRLEDSCHCIKLIFSTFVARY